MTSNIRNYIKRHGLTKRTVDPRTDRIPLVLLPYSRDDTLEIYSNDDGTHVVAINITRNRFKILHADMVCLTSGWNDTQLEYETEAKPFWKDSRKISPTPLPTSNITESAGHAQRSSDR